MAIVSALARWKERFYRRRPRSFCHCEERKRRSNPFYYWISGLLRGACHQARIRATRWLAMTGERAYRCSGGISRPRFECVAISSRLYERYTRLSDGGRLATERLGRHSLAGRIGRGANPPPQFGHTLASLFSAQSAQKVHS